MKMFAVDEGNRITPFYRGMEYISSEDNADFRCVEARVQCHQYNDSSMTVQKHDFEARTKHFVNTDFSLTVQAEFTI